MSHARRLRRASGAALVAAAVLATGAAQSSEALAGDGIPLERTPSGHLLLLVTIGDAGPFPFILDTGSTLTVWSGTECAAIDKALARMAADSIEAARGGKATSTDVVSEAFWLVAPSDSVFGLL